MTGETHGFVRLPPDSTGKRAVHSVMIEFSLSGVTEFPRVGEFATFGVSTHRGYFSQVEITGASTCDVHVSLKDPIPNNTLLTLSENVLQNNSIIGAVATTGTLFYYAQSVIAGGENNINTMNVDNKGAASVRFTEGSPLFDAYGRMQASEVDIVAEYSYTYDDLPSKFTNSLTNGATVSHNQTQRNVILSCPTTTGAKVVRRSNVWHKSHPGVSQLIEMSVLIGDTGKNNVTRKWGYYDDEIGIRFELVNNTLNAVWRSSTSGVLSEIVIPQSQWNLDRLDGSNGSFNLSGVTLDLTKNNNFWFDVMCAAGSARCGVIIDNNRITCHEFGIGNAYALEHLVAGTLPVTWELENTGTAASTTELRTYCTSIKSEGGSYSPYKTFGADNGVNKTITSTTAIPLFSGRAKQLFKTLPNRKYALPCEVNAFTSTAPIIIELIKNGSLTGSTWAGDFGAESCMESDISASAITGGVVLCSHIVKDIKDIDLTKIFNKSGELISRKAIISDTPDIYTFTAKLLSAGTTDVRISVSWKEI